MKKVFFLLCMFFLVQCLKAKEGAKFTVGYLQYEILSVVDKTVEVDRCIYNSGGMRTCVIPSSVNFEGVEYSVVSIGGEKIGYRYKGAFEGFNELTSIILPDNLVDIGASAFYGCFGLTSITLPNSLTNIGDYAFYNCSELTSITLPNGLTKIGNSAFSRCTSLTEFKVDHENLYYCSVDGVLFSYDKSTLIAYPGAKKGDCIVQNGTTIAIGAFEYCVGLTSIILHNTMERIGASTFEGCTSLISVMFPDGLTEIGDSAFKGCVNLGSITLPDDLEKIGNSAFENCTKLMLTSSVFPSSITEIGDYAFKNCASLKSVALPNHQIRLGKYNGDGGVFQNCASLTWIIFPKNVQICGYGIIYGCKNLKEVYICTGRTVLNGLGLDSEIFKQCKFFVPHTMFQAYREYYSLGYEMLAGLYKCGEFKSQTTLTLTMSEMGDNNVTLTGNVEYDNEGNTIKVTPEKDGEIYKYKLKDLAPNKDYFVNMQIMIQGNIYDTDFEVGTTTITPSITIKNVGQTIAVTEIRENVGDATLKNKSLIYSLTEYSDPSTTENLIITDLLPGSEYRCRCRIQVNETDEIFFSDWKKFSTKNIILTSLPADAISNTSVTINAIVDCDTENGYGFEWRKYDAPNILPSNTVQAEKIRDKVSFRLTNLSPSTYYKYRPFYKSVSGSIYYGEWIAFGTADMPVLFAPTVETLDYAIKVENTNVTLHGYVLAGSENILQQGFEYWTDNIQKAKEELGMGTHMVVSIAGLEPNTTYKYRAFAKTASGTTYGNESEFVTGETPLGIYTSVAEKFQVIYYPNSTYTGGFLKILGVDIGKIRYSIYDINGYLLFTDELEISSENVIPIHLDNIEKGIYLLHVNYENEMRNIKIIVE